VEATDADLVRKANPFLAKLLLGHLAGDKEAQRVAGGQRGALVSATLTPPCCSGWQVGQWELGLSAPGWARGVIGGMPCDLFIACYRLPRPLLL
jgi:hypothetical protein